MKEHRKNIKAPIQLMAFKAINLSELRAIMSLIKSYNSSGNDDITSNMVKQVNELVYP